jgi:hypothetical protein
MKTVFSLADLSRPQNNANILDGRLDRKLAGLLSLDSSKATKKERKRKMATSTVNPTEQKKTWLEQIIDPKQDGVVETPFGFKIRPNGEYEARKSVFDIDKLERETVTAKYQIKNLVTAEDLEKLPVEHKLALVNLGLQRQALMEAKQTIAGFNAKAVNNFINNFRFMVQFKDIQNRKEQSTEIMKFIRANPPLMETLKVIGNEPDEDEEEEGNEA